MGNWRRVWMVGSVPAEQVVPLREAMTAPDWRNEHDDVREVHALTISGGLCGIGDWPAEVVNAVGNLYERDYTPEDVRDACERYVLPAAPGASLTIHCGGDWESSECVGAVKVEDGTATLIPPVIAKLPEIPESQIAGRMMAVLTGFRRGAS